MWCGWKCRGIGFVFWSESRSNSLLESIQTGSEFKETYCLIFTWVERRELEVYHQSSNNIDVKNAWHYTCTFLRIFVVCLSKETILTYLHHFTNSIAYPNIPLSNLFSGTFVCIVLARIR